MDTPISLDYVAWHDESWDYGNRHAISARVIDPTTGETLAITAATYTKYRTIEHPRTADRVVHFDIDGVSVDQKVTVYLTDGVQVERTQEEIEELRAQCRASCVAQLQRLVRAAELLSVKKTATASPLPGIFALVDGLIWQFRRADVPIAIHFGHDAKMVWLGAACVDRELLKYHEGSTEVRPDEPRFGIFCSVDLIECNDYGTWACYPWPAQEPVK